MKSLKNLKINQLVVTKKEYLGCGCWGTIKKGEVVKITKFDPFNPNMILIANNDSIKWIENSIDNIRPLKRGFESTNARKRINETQKCIFKVNSNGKTTFA